MLYSCIRRFFQVFTRDSPKKVTSGSRAHGRTKTEVADDGSWPWRQRRDDDIRDHSLKPPLSLDNNFDIDKDPFAVGGEAVIHDAVDEQLNRSVALKSRKKQRKGRDLLREARMIASLKHPNVVPIYLTGTDAGGNPFYMMPRFDSEHTLAQHLIERGESKHEDASLRKLLEIFKQICNTVAHAHSKNIIHLDLKPDNIIVDEFGIVYVMDWGLAVRFNEAHAMQHLVAGKIIGTPGYCSPEQRQGELDKLDRRSDVYGLGCILDAILRHTAPGAVGTPGFFGIGSGIGNRRLCRIATKARAAPPEQRYQTVNELIAAIDGYFDELAQAKRHFVRFILVLTLLVAVIGSSLVVTKISERKIRLERAGGLIQEGLLHGESQPQYAKEAFFAAREIFAGLQRPVFLTDVFLWQTSQNYPEPLWTIPGADSNVTALCLLPAGRGILGAGASGLIRWDLMTATAMALPLHHLINSPIDMVAAADTENLFAFSTYDGGLFVGSRLNGQGDWANSADQHGYSAMCFGSGPEAQLVAGTHDGRLIVMDATRGSIANELRIQDGRISDLAVSLDGTSLFAAGGMSVKEVDPATLEVRREFIGHASEVLIVAVSDDKRFLAACDGDGVIHVWTPSDAGNDSRTFTYTLPANDLAFGRDAGSNDYLFASFPDSAIMRWHLALGKPDQVRLGCNTDVDFTVLSDAECVGLVVNELPGDSSMPPPAAIQALPLYADPATLTLAGHQGRITALALSPDGLLVASAAPLPDRQRHEIIVWDVATGRELVRHETPHANKISTLAFETDFATLISAGKNDVFRWDVATMTATRVVEPENAIEVAAICRTGRMSKMVTVDSRRNLDIRDLPGDRVTARFKPLASWSVAGDIASLAVSPDGNRGLIRIKEKGAPGKSALFVVDLTTGGVLHGVEDEGLRFTAMTFAFMPTGDRLVVGMSNGNLCMWDPVSGIEYFDNVHSQMINAVVPDRSGSVVVTGGQDGKLRVWDVDNRKLIRTLSTASIAITSLCLGYDQQRLIAGLEDGTVRIMDLAYAGKVRARQRSLAGATPAREGETLALLHDWYALRGHWRWALELGRRAGNTGFHPARISMARCYWMTGAFDDAIRAFESIDPRSLPRNYVDLCRAKCAAPAAD